MATIIINGFHRKKGNTEKLIQKLFPEKTVIHLLDYNIDLYQYNHNYSKEDQFLEIVEEILKHDEIIFVTPVYWYAMSSLMKIFFDRITDLLTSKNALGYQFKNKKIQVITSSNGNHLDDLFFLPFQSTCTYLGMDFIQGKHYVNPISLI